MRSGSQGGDAPPIRYRIKLRTASIRFIPAIIAKQHSQNTSVHRSPQYALARETGAVIRGATGAAAGDSGSVFTGSFGASVVCAVMTQLQKQGCITATAPLEQPPCRYSLWAVLFRLPALSKQGKGELLVILRPIGTKAVSKNLAALLTAYRLEQPHQCGLCAVESQQCAAWIHFLAIKWKSNRSCPMASLIAIS
jgi:hypothetical protein